VQSDVAGAAALKKHIESALLGATELVSQSTQRLSALTAELPRMQGWLRQTSAKVSASLPDTQHVQQWVREGAAGLGWQDDPRSGSLEHVERVLTQIVAAIRQDTDRHARVVIGSAIGKASGVLAVGGVSALITSLGAASTGTAIASLSGAAATTAKLYWLGSTIGLGVAAGGVMLTAGGLGVTVAAGMAGKRLLIGQPRQEDDLQEHEKAILVACVSLAGLVKRDIESGRSLGAGEKKLVAEHALIPLVHQIDQHWDQESLEQNGKSECRPFSSNLALFHQRKLDRCRSQLSRVTISWLSNPSDR
jgi:hypothetical protein